MKNNIEVIKIGTESEMDQALKIRFEVFVQEQGCPAELELEYEQESIHFLARYVGLPAGAARHRKTQNGTKLERFAVRREYRNLGIGQALVRAVLADIALKTTDYLYLNAQTGAIGFYKKLGFVVVGDMFEEAGIQHYQMVLKPSDFINELSQ